MKRKFKPGAVLFMSKEDMNNKLEFMAYKVINSYAPLGSHRLYNIKYVQYKNSKTLTGNTTHSMNSMMKRAKSYDWVAVIDHRKVDL